VHVWLPMNEYDAFGYSLKTWGGVQPWIHG
jgi:hypothetical protein